MSNLTGSISRFANGLILRDSAFEWPILRDDRLVFVQNETKGGKGCTKSLQELTAGKEKLYQHAKHLFYF